MGEDQAFCRYCQKEMQGSHREVTCQSCLKSSVPLTERSISIQPNDVKHMMGQKEDFIFLDVRTSHERFAASIPGTIFIPLPELHKRIAEIPKEKEIVVHCHYGGRSRAATLLLLAYGFADVKNMIGGINAWSREIDHAVARY